MCGMCWLYSIGLQGKTLTYDGHERVEVSDVEALPGDVDEELDHLGSLLLFGWLGRSNTHICDIELAFSSRDCIYLCIYKLLSYLAYNAL